MFIDLLNYGVLNNKQIKYSSKLSEGLQKNSKKMKRILKRTNQGKVNKKISFSFDRDFKIK